MKQLLQKMIDHIDEHISEPLNLDGISWHVGLSKYYLNHMFSIYTGFSVMEYVRRKKLEYALSELASTNKRIVDIALDVGYSSERAFSRAVVRAYGHSPAYFRENSFLKTRRMVLYDLTTDPDETAILEGFTPEFQTVKQSVLEKGFLSMKSNFSEVKYEIIDKMTVLSGTAIGEEPEDAIIERMHRLAGSYGINVIRSFGFDSPIEGSEDVTKLRGYEYWLVIEDKELTALPDIKSFLYEDTSITVKQIPAFRYASLRITDPMYNPFELISTGWRTLVDWLEKHDFKEPDFKFNPAANCLEEVKTIDGITYMDIYIPVDCV